MRSCLVLSAVSLLASLSGCGPVDSAPSIPAEARSCPTQFGEDFTEARAVDIGDASSGTFVPYTDGTRVRLILGNQGSMMITPWVQVEALPGDAEETCHVVRLANEFEGPLADDYDGLASAQFNAQFIKAGSFLVSDGSFYQPFAWDRETLEGQKLELTVTVRGDGYEGTKSVSLVLE